MKNTLINHHWLRAAALSLALVASTCLGQFAQDVTLRPSGIQHGGDPGDTGIGNWGTFWITSNTLASCTLTFDPTMHSASDIPGSIYIVCDWNGSIPAQDTDINVGATLGWTR